MIDYQPFLAELNAPEIASWQEQLPAQIETGLNVQRYGDLPRWYDALKQLPAIDVVDIDLTQSAITVTTAAPLNESIRDELVEQLKKLHPWRKGPFNLFDITIDTEWRSDWKWARLCAHISPLHNRRVLDVGCGSGYHCWRMRGAGAKQVIGIEPSPLFVVQFYALQKYINDHRVGVLPVGIEQLPPKLHYFDTVFSMGVLYHRRSPFDHLIELRDALRPGGELVLETLVIEGDDGSSLVPAGRYGKMGNVWFIPTVPTLARWLQKVGFNHINVVDVTVTTTEEQRSTEWMRFHSLAEFLDPEDSTKTAEGYPAPMRAVLTATSS